jgi:hypothetical protein
MRSPCTLALAAVVALLTLTGCGRSDAGSRAVDEIDAAFRSGAVVEHLTEAERIVFANACDRGFRRRGAHVYEANGIQYRLVRAEIIQTSRADLIDEHGERLDVGPARVGSADFERLFNIISDEKFKGAAFFTFERLPGQKFIEERGFELLMASVSSREFIRELVLVQDESGWVFPTAVTRSHADVLRRIYNHADFNLRDKVTRRELADRLFTTAPRQN